MWDEVRHLHAQGLTPILIAERLQYSVPHVYRLHQRLRLQPVRRGGPVRRFDEEKARVLHKRGWVDRQIAAELRVSRETIQKWRRARDLPPNGWHRP